MARGGARVNAGRKPNVPNKATIERTLRAEQEMLQARDTGKKLAKDVLDEFMLLFAGMAAHHQPIPPGQPIPAGREPNEDKFEKWARLAVETAADLAKYQSPTFRAIAVSMPPPLPAVPDQKTIDGKVIEMPKDAISRSRLYQRVVNGR